MFRPLFNRLKQNNANNALPKHNPLPGKNILIKHYSYNHNSNWPNNHDDDYKKIMWFWFAIYLFIREPTQRPPPTPYM